MKILLFALLFIALDSYSQRDFDYTFYTMHCKVYNPACFHDGIYDSAMRFLDLLLPRKIEKHGDILTITSLENTADAESFNLKFLGTEFATTKWFIFMYSYGNDSLYIEVNPVSPYLDFPLLRKTYY